MMEKSGFRSAERRLRSLSRQIPAIATKSLAEDTMFIGKPNRLLAGILIHIFWARIEIYRREQRERSHTNEPILSDFYKRKRR